MDGEPDSPTVPGGLPPGPQWIIEYFRPDHRDALLRIALNGVILITVGVLSIGLGRSGHSLNLGQTAVVIFWAVGAVCTFGGPVMVVVGFYRVTAGDDYLALRNDGLAYNTAAGTTFIAWTDLAEVTALDELLVLRDQSGAEIRAEKRFADISTAKLVVRIERLRQRALMGLLRPPIEQPIRRR